MASFALDRRGFVALAGLLMAACLLYGITLDNGQRTADLVGGDLITHQYAQVQARPSNAPGYPLYTMGGWLWFHGWRALWPEANPISILSSYSTLWGVLALGLLFILLYRFTAHNLAISLSLSAFYAVTYFFWFYSVTTEQYTSAVLHTLAIVALVHAWDDNPSDGHLYGLAFLFGLGLAHMVTVLFVVPGVLIFLLWKRPGLIRRGRLLLRAALLGLLPLLSYVFVYVRGAQHPEWRGAGAWANTWQWFLSFISTQQGRDEMTWTLGPFTTEFPRLIWVELTPLLLVLGVAGWLLLGRRFALMYGLTAVIYFVFGYVDRLGNWYQVLMPLYPLALLGAGVAFARLWRIYPERLWGAALSLLLIGSLALKFSESYPRADQRNRADDTGLTPGQMLLATAPPAHAAIVASLDEKLALDYLTQIVGWRPDVSAVATTDVPGILAASRPLLVSTSAASYAAAESGRPLRYSSWGPGVLIASTGRLPDVPDDDFIVAEQELGDGLTMVGFRLTPGSRPGQVDIALALRAERTPRQDWSLSLRPLAAGVELGQIDHVAPAEGFTPTTSLHPGETVVDAFRFELSSAAKPEGMRIILYRQLADGTFDNLILLDLSVAVSASE